MQRICAYLLLSTGISLLSACSWFNDNSKPEVQTATIDNRYLGKWYEIAAVPAPFQVDCYCTSSTYKIDPDDQQEWLIHNQCRKQKPTGRLAESDASAWLNDENITGKLRVQFVWPFVHDYWIIYVDKNYQYTLAGTPDRSYFWILARQPQIPQSIYDELVRKAVNQGYSIEHLQQTPQCHGDKEISSIIAYQLIPSVKK